MEFNCIWKSLIPASNFVFLSALLFPNRKRINFAQTFPVSYYNLGSINRYLILIANVLSGIRRDALQRRGYSNPEGESEHHTAWVWISASSLTNCLILGWWLNLLMLQSPLLQGGNKNDDMPLMGLLWGLSAEYMSVLGRKSKDGALHPFSVSLELHL